MLNNKPTLHENYCNYNTELLFTFILTVFFPQMVSIESIYLILFVLIFNNPFLKKNVVVTLIQLNFLFPMFDEFTCEEREQARKQSFSRGMIFINSYQTLIPFTNRCKIITL